MECERCQRPGRCCVGFQLNGGDWGVGKTGLEALADLAAIYCEVGSIGLPFLPFSRRPDGRWLFWCPVLTREGRCGDYENRPKLCRDYPAHHDPLCWHHDEATAHLRPETAS